MLVQTPDHYESNLDLDSGTSVLTYWKRSHEPYGDLVDWNFFIEHLIILCSLHAYEQRNEPRPLSLDEDFMTYHLCHYQILCIHYQEGT